MIFEYALDPVVMNNWDSFRYFYDKFGPEYGRLISRFPRKWIKMVYEACRDCGDVEKKRIEERLTKIHHKMIKASRSYDSSLSWIENAEIQHHKRPFHAIISEANPKAHTHVLIAREIDESVPLWSTKTGLCVPRESCAMSNCVCQMLLLCSEVLFIDPHFDPSKSRYQNTLRAFLKPIFINTNIRRVEYHLDDKYSEVHFKNESYKFLPSIIPRGLEVTFFRWQKLEEGEGLHPRYILTDIGGVSIEWGLDEGNVGETTDIKLLSKDNYSQRWNDFQSSSPAYQFIDKLKIKGELDLSSI